MAPYTLQLTKPIKHPSTQADLSHLLQNTDPGKILEIKVYENIFFRVFILLILCIFFLLVLQPPLGVVFYSPLAGFSLLVYEVS